MRVAVITAESRWGPVGTVTVRHTECTHRGRGSGRALWLLCVRFCVRLQTITTDLVLTLSLLTNPTGLEMLSRAHGCGCIHSARSFPRRSPSPWREPRPLGVGIH